MQVKFKIKSRMCLKHFGADMFEKADYLKRTVFIPHACQQYLMNANWSLSYSSVILSFFQFILLLIISLLDR